MTKVSLTHRAHTDLAEIKAYSVSRWGSGIAEKYLEDITAALLRLKKNPDLLKLRGGVSGYLKFYLVNKHFLICDFADNHLIVLGIIHASRDIPARMDELEPTLIHEAGLMRKQFFKAKTKRISKLSPAHRTQRKKK